MRTAFTLSLSLVLGGLSIVSAQDPSLPKPETAAAAMKRAASYYRTHLSFAGGYASEWSRDRRESRVENQTGTALISIQPHGTTTVGLVMLEAYEVTGDPLYLQGATEAADALAWCQLASGGWGSDFSFELRDAQGFHFRRDLEAGDLELGERRAPSSLDDHKTQSAIRFLSEFANSSAGKDNDRLQTVTDFAWKGLLAAQAPNGAWPQAFHGPADPRLPVKPASYPTEWSRTFPAVKYTGYHTLNDGNLVAVLDLLLEYGHLDEAKQLGEFILLAQLPDPQPAWAQQYDFDMHPTWARKFEPPAVSSVESLGAIEILTRLWEETGDEKWIATVPAALDWLESRELKEESGTWARFYELQTDQPLYCVAETYELTYDDSNIPTHYGFKVQITTKLRKARERLVGGNEPGSLPDNEKGWARRAAKLAPEARKALEQQKTEGYWVDGDYISASAFVKRMRDLMDYVDAAKRGGETFTARLKSETPAP